MATTKKAAAPKKAAPRKRATKKAAAPAPAPEPTAEPVVKDEPHVSEETGAITLGHDTNAAPGEGSGPDGLMAPQDQMVRMTAEHTIGRIEDPHVPTESALEAGRLADRDDPRR